MSDGPDAVWLDKDFQPWRVWTIEMDDLPKYVRADTKEMTASQFVAGLMHDDNVRKFLSQRICCDGRDCGCQGADVGSYLEWIARPLMPAARTDGKERVMDDDTFKDGYRIIKPLPEITAEKGVQCGKCGMRFDHGKAYGYYCPDARCPIYAKATS